MRVGSVMGFHLLHNNHHQDRRGIPKGCMVVMVGHEGEEQLQRFVIPVMYVNHPLFVQLLKEAEEVYGFDHRGPLILPCHVEHFMSVQGMIYQDCHHSAADDRHQQHQHHHFLCFKA